MKKIVRCNKILNIAINKLKIIAKGTNIDGYQDMSIKKPINDL